ncbi:glutathione-dependent formaldehyde-activating enzyme [Mycena amicta]|nr:glutathione-dependent formaldehyde-activating enzyme [Mycena amicta]
MSLVSYHGNCHCGAFKFTFTTASELKQAVACDCSICSRNGYLFAKDGEFVVTKGDVNSTLSTYTFGTHAYQHKFCAICGTSILVKAVDDSVLLVNLRAIENIDLASLALNTDFKGSVLEPAYQPPTAPLPITQPAPGDVTYTGSCHCGAVAYTLVQPAKISTVTECNCSICSRNGVLLAYIATKDLTVRGGDSDVVTEYEFNTKQGQHTFCKTCGVLVYTRFAGPEDHSFLSPARRALNVRTLNGVDVSEFEVNKVDGKARGPAYVVPE